MAYARTAYTGDGSTTDFAIPFDYLTSTHVKVKVDGVVNTDWSFVTSSTLRFDSAPANGAYILVYRQTSPASRIVSFDTFFDVDGNDLNQDSLQAFYLAQEAIDLAGTVPSDAENELDASGKRITNLDDGVESTDAVTVGQTVGIVTSAEAAQTAAEAAQAAAETAQTGAETAETNAAASASSALSSKNAAATSETNAAASETAAAASETAAGTSETNAAASASAASTSETNAAASESAASTSETNAAASASAAATSETNAATSETNAAASAAAAALDAASLNIEAPTTGDAGKMIEVNATEDGFDLVSDVPRWSFKNLLHNGGFQVAQRSAGPFTSVSNPANNDDQYCLDGAILLSDGNDVVDLSRVTDSDFESGFAMQFDVETANKKFGTLFPLESYVCAQAIHNGTVSLQFKAKTTGSSITAIRAAVLAWDGTENSITSDVVSAWGAENTNPTLVANWTAENVASDLPVGNTVATFKLEGIAVDTASVKQLAVFIYTDETATTVADTLLIGDVQLEVGPYCTKYEHRPYAIDLHLCRRYFYLSRPQGNGLAKVYGVASMSSAIAGYGNYGTVMRTSPTLAVHTAGTTENCSGEDDFGAAADYPDSFCVRTTVTASGVYRCFNGLYTASAEL